ncbi:MAG: ATP-binding protein [Candidatus Eiseniibacteriota bacterium]
MGPRGESTVPGRRRGPLLLLLLLALILLVVNASNWFILTRVTESLDEALGLRLITVAAAAVNAATPALLLEPGVADDAFVRRVLEDVARRHELEDVFLMDPAGLLRFDLGGAALGERNPFLDLDRAAFERAASGEPAATPAMERDGARIKSGYAPVEDWDGSVRGVLGVSAGGGFFARVPALRSTLIAVSAGSALVVALLGGVLFGMSRRLVAAEGLLSRSEALAAMGMMAAGIAHEVRNPLSIISGTAARLRKKYGAGAEDPLFAFIPEEVERLDRILEGYLRFARDEPPVPEPCDLREIVERTSRLVEEEFGAKGVIVRKALGEAAVRAEVDPRRLQQVLLNLLLNAAQAMPSGGELELGLAGEGSRAVVRVSDRGRGLTAKELARAFEPFYTTKEKGSGLGLVLAKRIVEAHGGTITIANREGGGATVTVSLPVIEGRAGS